MSVDGSVSEPLSCGTGVNKAALQRLHTSSYSWSCGMSCPFQRVHEVVHSEKDPTVSQPVQAFRLGTASLADIDIVWTLLQRLGPGFLDVGAGLASGLFPNEHVDFFLWKRSQLNHFLFECFDEHLQRLGLQGLVNSWFRRRCPVKPGKLLLDLLDPLLSSPGRIQVLGETLLPTGLRRRHHDHG